VKLSINIPASATPPPDSPLPPSSPPTPSEHSNPPSNGLGSENAEANTGGNDNEGESTSTSDSESDSSSEDQPDSSSNKDIVPASPMAVDGMNKPDAELTRRILDEAEQEEIKAERKSLSKNLRSAQDEWSRLNNMLTAVDIALASVATELASSREAASKAKKTVEQIAHDLRQAVALEAVAEEAYHGAVALVKSIGKSNKSRRREAKTARKIAKTEVKMAAAKRLAVSSRNAHAIQAFSERDTLVSPLQSHQGRVKTQRALLGDELADAEKAVELAVKEVNIFNSMHRTCHTLLIGYSY
jgi:hypothetical protein